MEKIRIRPKVRALLAMLVVACIALAASFAFASPALAVDLQAPETDKVLTPNGDGTYNLSLSVNGKSEAEQQNVKADVIVVFDTSGSMGRDGGRVSYYTPSDNGGYYESDGEYKSLYYYEQRLGSDYHKCDDPDSHSTVYTRSWVGGFSGHYEYKEFTGTRFTHVSGHRIDAAKASANNLARSLLANNTAEHPDTVQMALVSFSDYGYARATGITDADSFATEVIRLYADGGTNWHDGLLKANAIDTREGAEVFIIFVSDGNPTFYMEGDKRRGNGSSDPNGYCYDHAAAVAQDIVDEGKTLYSIGAFGSVDRMRNLADDAYGSEAEGAKHYFDASDYASLAEALDEIAKQINKTFAYTDVSIADGISDVTAVATVDGKIADPVVTKTTKDGTTSVIEGSTIDFSNGVVSWDLSTVEEEGGTYIQGADGSYHYVLEDGAVYTLTFKVWPNQGAFDQVSEFVNDPTSYDSDEYPLYVENADGTYSVYSNDECAITYSQANIDDDDPAKSTISDPVTSDIEKYPMMPVPTTTVHIEKIWDDNEDALGLRPSEITVDVVRDQGALDAISVDLTADDGWTADIIVPLGPDGHTYQVVSEGDTSSYTFAPSEEILIKGLAASSAAEIPALQLRNTLNSGSLHISKVVETDSTLSPDPDAEFTFTITLSDASINGTYSNVTFTNGVATLTLKDGAAVDVEGLPLGVGWTVEETSIPDGFTPAQTSFVGEISDEEIGQANFVNTYESAPAEYVVEAVKTFERYDKTPLEIGSQQFALQLVDRSNNNPVGTAYVTQGDTTGQGDAAFEPLHFDEPGEYVYVLSEVNGGTKVDGVQMDGTQYVITITVEEDADNPGHLIATADKAKDELSFVNVYAKPAPAEAFIAANKTLVGDTLKDGMFSFLVKVDGVEAGTVSNDENGVILFECAPFSEEGQYVVELSELDGSGPYICDTKTLSYTVTVTDNGKGQLIADVVSPKSVSFVNYTEVPFSVLGGINVTKTLTGRDMEAGQFTVAVEPADDASEAKFAGGEYATPAGADGQAAALAELNIAFGQIAFSALDDGKTYTWVVSEEGTAPAGYTYDTSHTVSIAVAIEDGSLVLTTTVDNATYVSPNDEAESVVAQLNIANTYEAAPNSFSIVGTKTLTGRALNFGEFEFNLMDASDTSVADTVVNDANGGFAFENVQLALSDLTKVGTGEYTVQLTVAEDLSSLPEGVDPVTAAQVITVNFIDNGDGTMSATVVYPNDGTEVALENAYSASDATINVVGAKVLAVAPPAVNPPDITGKYTFSMSGDSIAAPLTATNDAAGNVDFGTLSFSMDDLEGATSKDFAFQVTESGSVAGVTNDTNVYTVNIRVTDNGDGTMSAVCVDDQGEPISGVPFTFTNTYGIEPTPEPQPITDQITVTKILEGRDLEAGEFSFQLKEGDKVVDEAAVAADGTVTFEGIVYDEPGVITYTLSEVDGGTVKDGVTYDSTVYTITTTVTDNGDGTLSVTHQLEDAEEAVFTNKYKAAPAANVVIEASKTLNGRAIVPGEFTFSLMQDGVEIATASNTAEGKVAFDGMTFTEEGTFVYQISEIAGSEANMTYDQSVITAVVTVTDNGKGQLIASVEYDKTPAFVNTYKAEPKPEDNPGSMPKTGDHSAAGMIGVLMVLAAGVAFMAYRKMRKLD